MKKLLVVAIASVTALSGFAQADSPVKVKGEVEIRYDKNDVKDADPEMITKDVKLIFDYKSEESAAGFKALAYYESEFVHDSGAAKLTTERAYAGFEYKALTFKAGYQKSMAEDKFGVGQDIKFGISEKFKNPNKNDVISLTYKVSDDLTVAASTRLPEKKFEVEDENGVVIDVINDQSAVDLFVEYKGIEGLKLAGAFQSYKLNENADSITVFGAQAKYVTGPMEFRAEYSHADLDKDADGYEINGAYKLTSDVKAIIGFGSDTEEELEFYGNVQYAFVKGSKMYVELASNTADNAELGYTAGISVKF